MKPEYRVKAFVPKVSGCGAQDMGWDETRCEQFQTFINEACGEGWKLHSYEYRHVMAKGCGSTGGQWLVCIFEKTL